jgi:hypothetical protein
LSIALGLAAAALGWMPFFFLVAHEGGPPYAQLFAVYCGWLFAGVLAVPGFLFAVISLVQSCLKRRGFGPAISAVLLNLAALWPPALCVRAFIEAWMKTW